MSDELVVYRRGDRVEVERWPARLLVDPRLLDLGDPNRIRWYEDDREVSLAADNGWAVYRVLRVVPPADVLECELLDATLFTPAVIS